MLKDKNILFIGPIFHDYHQLINKKLVAMGANVTFYPERSYGALFKIINNFFNKHLSKYQSAHYQKILKKARLYKFDYLFVIRGYMLPEEFLIEFKKLNPHAKLIMYQWDSNKTNKFERLLPYFDHSYSFDFADCDTYPALNYIPLFYSDDVKSIMNNKTEPAYDFFFMGWFFPERYNAVIKFKAFAKENGFKLKAFLYMPFSSYLKERLRGTDLDMNVISLKHMARHEYLDILSKTNIMVDVSNPEQTGLAMRIIEALASCTKILTNNYKIKQDNKVYDSAYIDFFDENNPVVDRSFLDSNVNHKINGLLSLEDWLEKIFQKTENEKTTVI